MRSTIPVDLVKAYWTPPLHPKAAFEVERNQIEVVVEKDLDLNSKVKGHLPF
jgi:hypothetical protein